MRRDALRLLAVIAPPALAIALGACSWDFGKVFDRDDPRVEQARHDLEASAANPDADLAPSRASLEDFLDFRCVADGGQDLVIDRPFASVDLGLVTFRLAELVGQRFGDEELDAGARAETIAGRRAQELECAHLLLIRVVKDPKTPAALALRARYLLGNFAFLARRYQDAIDDYDQVLLQHPARGVLIAEAGPADDEDAIARDAAWNRAIALQRLEDEKKRDAGPDAPDGQDAPPDAPDAPNAPDAPDGSDGGDAPDGGGAPDGSEGGTGDSGDGGGGEAGRDGGSDSGSDSTTPPPPKPAPSTSARPMPSTAVDVRELNRFDEKSPLDLELPFKKRPRLPRSLDK